VRWVREAPVGGEAGGPRKKKKNSKTANKGKAKASVEDSMAGLKVDESTEGFEPVEEEVD